MYGAVAPSPIQTRCRIEDSTAKRFRFAADVTPAPGIQSSQHDSLQTHNAIETTSHDAHLGHALLRCIMAGPSGSIIRNGDDMSVNVQDWRLHATAELDKDQVIFGTFYSKGTVVKQAANLKLPNKKTLLLHVPNATALFLSSSHRAYSEARALRKKNKLDSSLKPAVAFQLDDEDFVFLECMMSAIVAAYTAIEAFVNQSIPDDVVYQKVKAGVAQPCSKAEIERCFTLKEKLSTVLPEALSLNKPVGHKCWNEFHRLEAMRDRLIHMKSADQNVMGDGKGTVWEDLFGFPEPVKLALPILTFLASQMVVQRRWLTHRPF
jgi:hypothetical protein